MDIIEFHFPVLSSTNTWAKEHLSECAKDKLTLVTAEEQTAGRGRYGRKWISPKNLNICASFVFFIPEDQKDPYSLTHVLAISVLQALEKWGVKGKIKWPNDLMVEGKKIAGILCETVHEAPYFGVIIGIGLNINIDKETLDTVGQRATSLSLEIGKKVGPKLVLDKIKANFSKDLDLFLKESFTPFLPEFRKLLITHSI